MEAVFALLVNPEFEPGHEFGVVRFCHLVCYSHLYQECPPYSPFPSPRVNVDVDDALVAMHTRACMCIVGPQERTREFESGKTRPCIPGRREGKIRERERAQINITREWQMVNWVFAREVSK